MTAESIDVIVDVDSEEYVTLRDAMARTGRSRPTIVRWVKAGRVKTHRFDGVVGYSVDDLVDAEADAYRNQVSTRRTAKAR